MKEILCTTVEIGLNKPIKVLQITDVHITESNENDSDAVRSLTEGRRETFYGLGRPRDCLPQEFLKEAFSLAEAQDAFPVLTGDIMDMDTAANREEMHHCLGGKDFLYTAGTHEFQTIHWLEPLDEAGNYYNTIRKEMMREFGNWDFDHRILGGVNLITMDNSQDFFTEDSYLKLQGEIRRGLPIVLFMHVPLNCPTLRRSAEECNNRFSQFQYEVNLKTIDLIQSCPLIKAVFAGHWHCNREFPEHQPPVYVTPGAFSGVVRMIEIR